MDLRTAEKQLKEIKALTEDARQVPNITHQLLRRSSGSCLFKKHLNSNTMNCYGSSLDELHCFQFHIRITWFCNVCHIGFIFFSVWYSFRTQLMLTEFKRDNKQRDYERMSEDLNRRKRELKGYEDQLRSRTSDILQIDQSHLDDRVWTFGTFYLT